METVKLNEQVEQAYEVFYMTSGQVMCFDKAGDQLGEIQIAFAAGGNNRELLSRIAANCNRFAIGKWRDFNHDLTKEEFMTITNTHPDSL